LDPSRAGAGGPGGRGTAGQSQRPGPGVWAPAWGGAVSQGARRSPGGGGRPNGRATAKRAGHDVLGGGGGTLEDPGTVGGGGPFWPGAQWTGGGANRGAPGVFGPGFPGGPGPWNLHQTGAQNRFNPLASWSNFMGPQRGWPRKTGEFHARWFPNRGGDVGEGGGPGQKTGLGGPSVFREPNSPFPVVGRGGGARSKAHRGPKGVGRRGTGGAIFPAGPRVDFRVGTGGAGMGVARNVGTGCGGGGGVGGRDRPEVR